MPVEKRKFITRKMVRAEAEKLFIFGDNMARWGLGGQAREMRGEPNSVGFPTKQTPGNFDADYLKDSDLPKVQEAILKDIARCFEHLRAGGTIVLPEDGIGTGFAQLATRAPKVLSYYDKLLRSFDLVRSGENADEGPTTIAEARAILSRGPSYADLLRAAHFYAGYVDLMLAESDRKALADEVDRRVG